MLIAALSLATFLTLPAELPHVDTSVQPAFPTIAADQRRPTADEAAKARKRARAGSWDCFQYYGCYPLNAPPNEQWCVYTGYPNNGCLINAYGNCDLCQVCCENCFC
jgi:hypothetical protein